MPDLVERTGGTVRLARLEDIENVYVAIRHSRFPVRMRLQSHATGTGKALLSTVPEAEARRGLPAVAMPMLTENCETDVGELLRIIRRTRDLGFAMAMRSSSKGAAA